MRGIHERGRGTYGSLKLQQALKQAGVQVGRNRIVRLMKEGGLEAKRVRITRRTTKRKAGREAAPNLLNQRFTVERMNQVWLADITYIRLQNGWLYLAVVMDLYSRRIIGWAMAEEMTDELTQSALQMAVQNRGPLPAKLMHHSDQGSQYTSGEYSDRLKHHQITVSMSGVGNCYDNAPMESFFSNLKLELIYHVHFASAAEARLAIFDYIERFYNRVRMHSSIDYLAPVQFEQRGLALLATAAQGLTSERSAVL
jgi:transposase InsO family protein